jgi:D-alanyl-D-alanine dipeptidase
VTPSSSRLTPVLFLLCTACAAQAQQSPRSFSDAFVSITDIDPTIVVEARYYGSHNFIGRRITGYEAPKCMMTREAATALAKVQADLRAFGLGIKTYDCYRPQRAVSDFVAWARDTLDTKMKAEFYPLVDKRNLFRDGYIAERSGHSRGSTIDLTIIPLPAPPQAEYRDGMPLVDCRRGVAERFRDNSIDMGTGYDCFDPQSHTVNPNISAQARVNRLLLKSLMEKHGFRNYANEWWHYTLNAEPFADTFFDEPVR